jgi:nicotinamidase-related amidase
MDDAPLPYNPLLALADKLPRFPLDPTRLALLIIDMQNAYVNPQYGILAKADQVGVPREAMGYYRERLTPLIANIGRLQRSFRSQKLQVIFFKIESVRSDGRDRGLHHTRLGIEVKPGSNEAQIVKELEPQHGDIVIGKTVSSPFNGTNIDFVLRSMRLDQLVITGVVTNGCVETTVRDAADRGYEVILIEDACAAMTREIHENSIDILRDDFANVRSTHELLAELDALNERPARV